MVFEGLMVAGTVQTNINVLLGGLQGISLPVGLCA